MTLRITLLLMLVSLLGCTTEFQRTQPAQPVAENRRRNNIRKSQRCQLSPIVLECKYVAASPLRSSSAIFGFAGILSAICPTTRLAPETSRHRPSKRRQRMQAHATWGINPVMGQGPTDWKSDDKRPSPRNPRSRTWGEAAAASSR